MNVFKDIPGLEEELGRVADRAREMTKDALLRQPLSEIVDSVFTAPGKLLRPALLLLFGRFGPDCASSGERLCSAGAVVELTHMASLIHDDIVDDAPFRRGRPTVQSAYGKDMAVYAGDYLLSRVLDCLMRPDMAQAGQVLSRGISDMCIGELGQHAARFDVQTDENRYFMNISGKTAALFSASCEMGALISGGTRYTVSAASRFGHSLGVLFQLRDDLTDCLPESVEAGKKRGMDFINGIYTLPVIYSFADSEYGAKLRELAASAAAMEPEAVFGALYEYITKAGGVDYTRWIMKQYRERALNSMTQLPNLELKPQLASVLDLLLDC